MSPTRRQFLASASAVGLLAAAGIGGFPIAAFAQNETVDTAALMEGGPLDDKVIGEADAPVTVVEYASLTCSHCRQFHEATFPQFKEKYVDTGKVRYILREFPLDPVAAGAVMLARCAPEDRFFTMIDLLFDKQPEWAFTENPRDALLNLVKQAGFTQQSFEACLTNQELLDGVNWVRNRGAEEFNVDSTPTFFINGARRTGALSLEEISAAIDPLLN